MVGCGASAHPATGVASGAGVPPDPEAASAARPIALSTRLCPDPMWLLPAGIALLSQEPDRS